MKNKTNRTVWAKAPRRSRVEKFSIVGEYNGNHVALDEAERPVLLPLLSVYETRQLAIVGQKEARKGWVATFKSWGSVPTIQRCRFNPQRDPRDRYAPSMHYWQAEDGEVHSSRNAVFGLTKKEVLGKIAGLLPREIESAQNGLERDKRDVAHSTKVVSQLVKMRTECRRAGFKVSEPKQPKRKKRVRR